MPLPEGGSLEALLVIGSDGIAQLADCPHGSRVCEALQAALVVAEFAPATLNGKASAARVQVRFSLTKSEASEASEATVPGSVSAAPAAVSGDMSADAALPSSVEEPAAYGAVARVEAPKPLATSLELEEMREVPGSFGDPFRVIDALPGVVPVMTGLPYVYVRAAPPSATAYFYDDIQLPALFHLALGPAVVHPAMVGGIDFYPGVAPARYGRKTGGVVAGKALLRDLKPGVHGELELRLVDMQAYLATPIRKGGRLEIAGRYGYPGLAIKLLDSQAVVQYWDYQLRAIVPLSRRSEATLIALGSFDLIGQRKGRQVERELELQFHRVEARIVEKRNTFSIGSALTAGFERSGLGEELRVHAMRVGPKVWLDTTLRGASLRFGADMLATSGKLHNLRANSDSEPGSNSDFVFSNHPIYRSATGRNVIGMYGELRLPLSPRVALEAGLRGDTWITGGDTQSALEPRALVRFQTNERLTLHAAAGLAYQPAVFLIPLPGISDVALDRGLQRAIQSEVGARLELPQAFSIESKLFAHFYNNMLSIDAVSGSDVACKDGNSSGISEQTDTTSPSPTCNENKGFARISARAIGSEWLIRRAFGQRLSGWLSYTLAKAEAHSDEGKALTPNFDVRHVANLVFQWRVSPRWHVALRGFAQSGRFPLGSSTAIDPRERARLPAFYRGDLQLARIWQRSWGELRFSFDWLNFTFQREPLGWNCSDGNQGACVVEHVEFPITLPMLGVRGSY